MFGFGVSFLGFRKALRSVVVPWAEGFRALGFGNYIKGSVLLYGCLGAELQDAGLEFEV